MNRLKIILCSMLALPVIGLASPDLAAANDFEIRKGKDLKVSIPKDHRPVLTTALSMLGRDLRSVFGDTASVVSSNPDVKIEINPSVVADPQGFLMEVTPEGTLSITGHDSHGAAYALMELSRRIGVSPWEWWADATPRVRDSFKLPKGFSTRQAPDVEYRGIFINDEDWGLMPWSSMTMEPGNKRGVVGPQTNARIFELLLRLRANYYWPAMHECTEPFFLTPGNREMADKYGIYIGGSHCEPMASSTAVEWGRRGVGDYDYVNNSDNVLKFWEDRVKDVAGQEIVYTLGMRGVHDGAMNGTKTVEEQKNVLSRAIADQRSLLAKYVNKDVEKVPQVFIPYKEVLDVYNAGLEVPEDVTLMWCDDNYGNIRHFPTPEEASRKGGNGVYYHVSYWGRPHDYLWLGTFNPYLMWQQMKLAYDKGIREMWILNVGDIKPAEYQIELFMDMAWNIDAVGQKGVKRHMQDFFAREFGEKNAKAILPMMNEYYHLASIRRPEFLGNTRCEEYGTDYYNHVRDLPWTDSYIQERLKDYASIEENAESILKNIPSDRLDTYFQLVKYPVQASAEMNKKMLYGQLARHGKADWAKNTAAYDSIVSLTKIYNQGIANGGKWRGIMDFQPRKQPVFAPLKVGETCAEPDVKEGRKIEARFSKGYLSKHEGLGHTGHAIEIGKGKAVTYSLGSLPTDSVTIALNFLPNHPVVAEEGLKVEVSLDGGKPVVFDYATSGRSEEWKENILNGRAVRRVTLPVARNGKGQLKVKPLSEGVILDWIEVF